MFKLVCWKLDLEIKEIILNNKLKCKSTMKLIKITLLIFFVSTIKTFGQSSFSLPGDGNWYRIAKYGGAHAYMSYKYRHRTAHNPSIATGEILFINAKSHSIQNHHTMGYNKWGQPQFALINLGNTTEIWAKASQGVTNSIFTITDQLNIDVNIEKIPDSDLTDNGGSLKIYDKLRDNSHIFEGTTIFNNGRVGIGTDSPVSKLHVEDGSIAVGDQSEDNWQQIKQIKTTGSSYGYNFQHNNASVIVNEQGDTNEAIVLGDADSNNNSVLFGISHIQSGGSWTPKLTLTCKGNLGIGNEDPQAKLQVSGDILADEIRVEDIAANNLNLAGDLAANNITVKANGQTADFVFEEDYHLKDLSEVENFIKTNKHLPDIPSATEMEEQGVNLAEMNKLLLQKVEELTLYSIEKDKEVESLRQKVEGLEGEKESIEERLKRIEALLIK